jgi:iron complex outermembrane receptor protein
LSCVLLLPVSVALADTDVDDTNQNQARIHGLDPVVVTAQALHGPQAAPSQGSLVAVQPQSIVGADFIQNNDAPAVNYTDIIKFTPSVWTVDPNGPGLMENLGTSIRGFQDGQFNVTLDGIPWGDSNDFTHHSTSYFMSQDLANVIVDRGPGNAATVGDATFGGTLYMQSADPSHTVGLNVLASYGSFNTQLYGVRFDTGEISEWGGTRAFLSVKSLSSDGYLTNAFLSRTNEFFKAVQPLNDATDITFVSNLNKLKQSPPVGATPNQMAAFGMNYGYNNDLGSQGYWDYNVDKITTDYEYIGLNSKFSGWTVDNKLYTYAYYHDGYNGEDVGGVLPNGGVDAGDIPNGTVNGPNNVPGQVLTNNYRSVGDILRLSYDLGFGDVQFGGWFDHQSNYRRLVEVDFSDNQAYNPSLGVPPGGQPQAAYTDRLQHNQLFSREAYAQFVWHLLQGLDLTAGDKYVNFERVIVSPVNQGTELPLDYSKTWTRNLPSVDLHYKIQDNWSAYAQYARGFLAPNLNVLYVVNPALNTVNPEGTTNVQLGTTWVGQGLTVSADVYTINFSNQIASHSVIPPGGGAALKQFYNLGATKYKGVEAEATYAVGWGVSIYGNWSYNSARLNSDQSFVPLTPNHTAALGVLYNQGPLQASIIDKYVGVRYGDSEDTYRFNAYSTADAALNYVFDSFMALKNAKVGVTLQNITDRHDIYFLNGYTSGATPAGYVNGNPLFFRLPGRSVQLNLSASF